MFAIRVYALIWLSSSLRAKRMALVKEGYSPLPVIEAHMLPTLRPLPTPLPMPPTAPPAVKPNQTYEIGTMYSGKDVTGTWQLLNLTRARKDVNGTFEADVFQRVVLGEKPVIAAHWSRVMANPEYMRTTPPPPVTTPAPPPKFWKQVNQTGEWQHMAQNATNMDIYFGPNNGTVNGTYRIGNVTNGTHHNMSFPMGTPPPKVYEIAGGPWPLHWRVAER